MIIMNWTKIRWISKSRKLRKNNRGFSEKNWWINKTDTLLIEIDVSIKFNSKEFILSCDDGQEEHLEELLIQINKI